MQTVKLPPLNTSVPQRQQLLDRLEAANRRSVWWIGAQVLALLLVCRAINWQSVLSEPLISAVAVGIMVGPWSMQLLRLWAQPKKEIGDLREQTRFGEFDKHRLRMLQRETLRKLGLPDQHLPVYITAEKSLNAQSLHLGLGAFVKSLNGIYLHRQVLHKLDPEEVQDIMGHELGHYYRYYLLSDRFEMLTILLGGSLGLLVSQLTGMSSYLSILISAGCASLFWRLSAIPSSRHGTAIEYLCDDLGAQVNGVHVSINGLLKLGVDAEVQLAIQQQAILGRGKNQQLSAREIISAVEAAVPYGHVSRDELATNVERSIQHREQLANQTSLAGFLKYAWQSDTEDEIDEQVEQEMRKLQLLSDLPRVPWESCLPNPARLHFEPQDLPDLIACIESQPDALLFRLPTEAGLIVDVHPPLRMRILYLWYNHDEIESRSPRLIPR